jgi:hypothetical protein
VHVPRSFITAKPRRRPLHWLAGGVGAVALAGALTALTITAASAAPSAAPNAQPSPTPSPTPVMFTITPSPLDFGAQVVGTTSADQSVTITNPSGQPQVLEPLVFVQNDFRLTADNCPDRAKNFLLDAGASCTASFNFTPFASGIRSLNVTLQFTSGGTPAQVLTLTGTGVAAGAQPAVITEGDICGSGVCSITGGGGTIAGDFFATQLSATGGTPPYTWSGQVSDGLTIQPDGVIFGTPTHTATFTVTVTDATGASGTAALSVNVFKPEECQSGGGNVVELTEPLSGPALSGQTPSGTATLTENNGNQVNKNTGAPCAISLMTQVSGVNLPDGTQLWVAVGILPVGMITLSGGSGSMAPYANPPTDGQVNIYTAFPTPGAQPILQGAQFG